jgi:hypothetical protein
VFFDGGGACWDDITCSVPRRASDPADGDGLYKAELIAADDPSRLGGIFDFANPNNPLRDWSMVFVPYCTGDVHAGSNTALYTDPDTGEPYRIEHRGADNLRSILAWMSDNVPAPRRLLVTGSSAGAYGAAFNYSAIRAAYPGGQAVMLGDAGQGGAPPDFLAYRNRNWNYHLPAAVFGPNASLTADADVVARLAAHYPRDRFAQYTTTYDFTQRAYYALTGGGEVCSAWTDAMTSALSRRQQTRNFRSYLAAGQTHAILRSALFYTERSAGIPFTEWLGALLNEETPDNRSCEDCFAPPRDRRLR